MAGLSVKCLGCYKSIHRTVGGETLTEVDQEEPDVIEIRRERDQETDS